MGYNKKEHLRCNIEAIRTVFGLDREREKATTIEKTILEKYTGFGGIKAILNPAPRETPVEKWPKADAELYQLIAELHELLRQNSAYEKEYKRYVDSLKASVLTAFYTPAPVIDALAGALKISGITPGRFLDPSAGTGAFPDVFRQHFPYTLLRASDLKICAFQPIFIHRVVEFEFSRPVIENVFFDQ